MSNPSKKANTRQRLPPNARNSCPRFSRSLACIQRREGIERRRHQIRRAKTRAPVPDPGWHGVRCWSCNIRFGDEDRGRGTPARNRLRLGKSPPRVSALSFSHHIVRLRNIFECGVALVQYIAAEWLQCDESRPILSCRDAWRKSGGCADAAAQKALLRPEQKSVTKISGRCDSTGDFPPTLIKEVV